MGNADIVIRKAVRSDAGEIWQLLHNNSIPWDMGRIHQEIDFLNVLSFEKKLLGVFHGSVSPGFEKISWVAGHPMYAEDSLRAALVYSLFGVICRLPGTRIEQLMKSYLKMPINKPNSIGFGIR
ncbi:hypothetical protein SAMN05660649_01354 [Desulfotomaculum arcticum]|uniref:Acetyltransferase (GNAT) domain-containing protein n=1 Tax=Desulfotruncus arcticus DSM 17038 TaxID=1121424 RepID=A0A1I2R217_9FIRM|nr:hypothetical protein [Desulfotruncus arcticus]SFG34548.1 hypothetical protein SAMN05660649_01354 [Desulfotomaculum arcticum] [Desulfotruncus arcticus DSM 17038]